LIGEHGESGKRPLDNKLKDDFQRGKYVTYLTEVNFQVGCYSFLADIGLRAVPVCGVNTFTCLII